MEIDVDIYLVADIKTAKESTKNKQPTVKEYQSEKEEKEKVK